LKATWRFAVLLVLPILGCGTGSNYAPLEDRSKTPFSFNKHHIVSKGETLYSIAWRYNLNVRGLAVTNKIVSSYIIRPGDKLLLNDQAKVTSSRQYPPIIAQSAPVKAPKKPVVPPAKSVRPMGNNRTPIDSDIKHPFRWQWPSNNRISKLFSTKSPQHKGIDLLGVLREPVYAANSGKVVYAGSGLAGYGNLLILKHGDRYLSAYAHNSRLLVNEGQRVNVGQKIAEMGDTGTSTHIVKLHFEIRRDGKPVNPIDLMPKRK
jgi:lipoprotein NlpD